MRKVLADKINAWANSVDDPEIRGLILQNSIVTGGAIVSMLQNEPPNDFDVYFRSLDALQKVASYYVDKFCSLAAEMSDVTFSIKPVVQKCVWNEMGNKWCPLPPGSKETEGVRLRLFIRNRGVAGLTEYEECPDLNRLFHLSSPQKKRQAEKESYIPIFLSTNAMTLSDKIQLVLRFYGEPDQIHKSYDFTHCKCYYTSWDNNLQLPAKALEAILTKELYYEGSEYPLCSLIRSRKYMERGWHPNAGQFLKMALQINALDLKNIHVFEEQLVGVDTVYFNSLIELINQYRETGAGEPDESYLMEMINLVFDQ